MSDSHTSLHYHIVFTTKNRSQQIRPPEIKQRLYDYMAGIVKNKNGLLITAGGTADHVHLLVKLHPQTCVADMVRDIKANAARWLHQTFPTLGGFAWQNGYGAFSVSYSNVPQVRSYIETQEEHHRKFTFEDELKGLLARHDIVLDEKVNGS